MRLAVHTQSLQDIFASNCDPITGSTVLASSIALTPAILNQYHVALGSNAIFQAWFSALNSTNRFSVHLPQVAPTRVQACDLACDGFATAAYFGASTLVAELQNLPNGSGVQLDNIGVDLLSVKRRILGTSHGDNPFLTIVVRAGGSDGFDIFDRFIKAEDSVVVYDKYINTASVELLEHIASKLAPGSSFQIFHSSQAGRHLLLSNAIETRVQAANTAISVTCKCCPHAFTTVEHDRYLFLGKRIQVVFTVGLDCFGSIDPATGKRSNRSSKIMFFDVTGGDQLEIRADDGSVCLVNHLSDLPQ